MEKISCTQFFNFSLTETKKKNKIKLWFSKLLLYFRQAMQPQIPNNFNAALIMLPMKLQALQFQLLQKMKQERRQVPILNQTCHVQVPQGLPYRNFDPVVLGFTTEMLNLINAQNMLINRLLVKQDQLATELAQRKIPFEISSATTNRKTNQTKTSSYRQLYPENKVGQNSFHFDPQNPLRSTVIEIIQRKTDNDQDREFSSQVECKEENCSSGNYGMKYSQNIQDRIFEKKKQTESKNMVKNFSKAIFNFIRKDKKFRLDVLNQYGIQQFQFMQEYERLKGHIHSISELRYLWIPKGNPYHKAFRILSYEYLRKHCLQRVFNSRVQNYNVHLKYRQRLLQSLQDPNEFTSLKTT